MAVSAVKKVSELKVKLVTQSCTLSANQHKSFTINFTALSNVVAVLMMNSNNEAWVFGHVKNFGNSYANIGLGSTYNGSITSDVTLAVFYYD